MISKKEVLSKFTSFCWAALTAILGCGSDTPGRVQPFAEFTEMGKSSRSSSLSFVGEVVGSGHDEREQVVGRNGYLNFF